MILTVLFIFGSSAIGHTSEKCTLFEGTFKKETRRPVAQFQYFQALDGKAIVKVYTNENLRHHKMVDSAVVAVNGKKVIRVWDFYKHRFYRFWHFRRHKFYHSAHVRQNDGAIEKTVELTTGQNSLEVMLNSRRGGEIKVVIEKPKDLASTDSDCDLISSDGDESGIASDNPCTGGNTAFCDDNCPNDFNPDQADADGDGIGDMCDAGDRYPNVLIDTINVETKPYGGIAVSPDGAYVFVTNYGTKTDPGSTVSVIKTIDNSEIATIPVGLQPFGVSLTPDGTLAYVSNYGSNSVSVIDTDPDSDEFNQVITTISVGVNGPFGISLTPDGAFAYVNNYGTGTAPGTVSVIDTDPGSDEFNQVIATIPVGLRPFGVSVTPNGEFAYVSNFGTGTVPGTVSVIQTDINEVIATIPVGIGPEGVSVTPNGAYAYVTNYLGNSVSVIQTDINEVIATIPIPEGVGPDGVAVTPDGAYVYVNNYGTSTVPGTISVIRTSNNEVIDTLSLGTRPHGAIAVSPFGDFVYVGNYGNDTVSVIGYDAP